MVDHSGLEPVLKYEVRRFKSVLGMISPTSKVVESLIELVRIGEDFISFSAAKGLSKLGEISVKNVGELLNDENAFVRCLAAKILSTIETDEAGKLLRRAAEDPEPPVRFAARSKWEFYD